VKLCIFIALCGCLVFYSIAAPVDPALENLGAGEYHIYSTENVSSELVTKTTDLGFSYIYHCESSDAAQLRSLFTHIDGESIVLENKSAAQVLRTLRYKEISRTDDIVYAYSPRGRTFINAGNKRVNLQIAKSNNTLVVGWPVILGSY